MGVVVNQNSEYAFELRKWNTPKNQFVVDADGIPTNVRGMGAIGYEPYPRMLYKAHKRENGRVMCGDNPMAYRDPVQQIEAEAFSRECQLIVRSEAEHDRAKGQGWRDSVSEALEYYDSLQQDIARAAAEANYAVARMSEQARAEHAAADAGTDQHVTDIVGTKRGRPKAVVAQE